MKIILVYLTLFSSSLSFSQENEQSLNLACGYNILGYRFNQEPRIDGIDVKLSYQKKWFEVGVYSGFIHQTPIHYKNSQSNKRMYDRFLRLGLTTNFQFLTTNRHLLGAGLYVGKIHLIEHFYYSESGGQITEVSCSGKDCPYVNGFIGEYDYLNWYSLQVGFRINYDLRLWQKFYLSSSLGIEYVTGYSGHVAYGGYQEWGGISFSPTIGLEYKFPLVKKEKVTN